MKPLKKTFFIAAEKVWLPIERVRLRLSGQLRLARALSARANDLFGRIEQRRAEMLKDNAPLVDGSLGDSGPYDQGQTVASVCNVSKPAHAARLLYSMAAEYRPKTIIELGTNVGILRRLSGGIRSKGDDTGGFAHRLRIARTLHQSLGLELDYVQGLFTETSRPTLDRIPPVEMAFIHGHHQYRPTLDYFEAILTWSGARMRIHFRRHSVVEGHETGVARAAGRSALCGGRGPGWRRSGRPAQGRRKRD